jgi:uncharacterized membrane protein YqaE (UPF0057 family)
MLIVLAFLCPPLAVLFTAGPTHAAKNFGLTLLLYVPGVLHARRVVERYTINRRYEALMRALDTRGMPAAVPAPVASKPRAVRTSAA